MIIFTFSRVFWWHADDGVAFDPPTVLPSAYAMAIIQLQCQTRMECEIRDFGLVPGLVWGKKTEAKEGEVKRGDRLTLLSGKTA